MDASTLIHKLDEVITKITKSKKFSSVRILEEVKQELIVNGIPEGSPASAAPHIPAFVPPSAPLILPDGQMPYVQQNGEVDKALSYIASGDNVLFTGATGCGKTHLAKHIATLLGKTLYCIQGEEGMRKEDILGYRHDVGEESYTYGVLPRAMQDDHGMLYWDEPNATPHGIQFVCFRAMDDRKSIILTDSKGGEEIKAKDGFVFLGAMNEGKGYRGTTMLNDAMRRRWGGIIELDYLPEAKERQLLVDRTGVDPNVAEKLCHAARQLRTSCKQGTISTPIGTGSLLAACRAIRNGLKVLDAIECSIVNQVAGQRGDERKIVSDVIAAHFTKGGK